MQFLCPIFSDAARPSEYGQNGYIDGLVIGDAVNDIIYLAVDLHYTAFKGPTKSTAYAETLISGEAVEMGWTSRSAYDELFGNEAVEGLLV